MNAEHPLSLLIYMTFAAVAIVAIIMLVRFFRRNDAHPMLGERERNIDEIREEGSNPADANRR